MNYTGKDVHSKLVREVVGEAVKILSTYQINSPQSMMWAIQECQEFLRVNFNIMESGRSDEWRINEFNRNRSAEDQVDSIEEMEAKVKEMF